LHFRNSKRNSWNPNRPFAEILGKYPLERILSDYRLMHEADITKVVQVMDAVVMAK
jgi:hypothetical protein